MNTDYELIVSDAASQSHHDAIGALIFCLMLISGIAFAVWVESL